MDGEEITPAHCTPVPMALSGNNEAVGELVVPTRDRPVGRCYRDAKLLDIGADINEIRRMLIGRERVGAG